MIQLKTNFEPQEEILNNLTKLQNQIDSLEEFELKVEKAKSLFKSQNVIGKQTFDSIKLLLTIMCSGARRCVYCEDSVADEIEHIYPKSHYPDLCFKWENYIYACGNCNGSKNSKFAVFRDDNSEFFRILRTKKGEKPSEPPKGIAVLLNPRIENPLDYCILDLNTFKFVIIPIKGSNEFLKADFTINEVLKLNDKEFLRKARKNAFDNYKARLVEYLYNKNRGESIKKLNTLQENLQSESHPTVWREMQRYHNNGYLKNTDKELDNIFVQLPESLSW